MSDEAVTLELLGAQLMSLTAEVRDLQQRFDGVETHLGALKARFGAMEGDLPYRKSGRRGCWS